VAGLGLARLRVPSACCEAPRKVGCAEVAGATSELHSVLAHMLHMAWAPLAGRLTALRCPLALLTPLLKPPSPGLTPGARR